MATQTLPRQTSVQLTAAEASLRQLLLDVAQHINPDDPADLRYTGGWVRDKLMGMQSHDIDVGINNMTGYQFGLKMKECLAGPGVEGKYGAQGLAVNLHKIEANPEKSKHLETVTTRMFGLDVDLVNLRKETYSEESRNPQMEYGTPQEDAMRRDATINAMFYNLRTDLVEDLTGHGYEDLENGFIRTPLEPYQTFRDDPLRVLRLIRFASRFGFSIDPSAEEAMGDASIMQALRAKISRERVGVEIEKMLKGPRPHMAFSIIDRLGLFETIFTDPEHAHTFQPEVGKWKAAYDCASKIIDLSQADLHVLFDGNEDTRYLTWILSSAVPWADAPVPEPSKQAGKQPPPIAFDVVRNGLKASMKICDVVRESTLHAEEIIKCKDACVKRLRLSSNEADPGSPAGRDTLGMIIRQWGNSYRCQLLFAIMLETARSTTSGRDVISEFITFVRHISKLELLDAPNFKPVIDGKTLAKELNTRPGPWMKSALDEIMQWQLRNPGHATPESALEAIRSKHGELPSCLVVHFLSLTIRPLFSQTTTHSQAGMTSQSRRSLNSQLGTKSSKKLDTIETPEEALHKRPWKQRKHPEGIQLLDWSLRAMQVDQKRTDHNWPLVVPPVLALIDDVDIPYKARGCQLLDLLLQATSPELLAKTGLGQVFEDAVTPCLSYLPTLTPEEDSVVILDAAYPALMLLADVRHSVPSPRQQSESEDLQRRERFLAHILHHHILRSFSHVELHDFPKLITCITRHLTALMADLGLATVAHLTAIIPTLNAVLACELGRYAGAMLAEASRSMQRLIAEAWPRVWRWRGEILKGICLAWVQAAQSDEGARLEDLKADLELAKAEMIKVVKMLAAAVDATKGTTDETVIDLKAEIEELITAEPLLKDLFRGAVQ
ncbi:MAG: hypothetical protein Q9159_002370 [Coniocarpon cinnabarinum]